MAEYHEIKIKRSYSKDFRLKIIDEKKNGKFRPQVFVLSYN